MSRLMSVAHTEQAVVDRTKTVTRRLGWQFAQPGMRLTLCRKVMGRRAGEPLVRLAEVEVVDVRREILDLIDEADVVREGFPGWAPWQFVQFFVDHMGIDPFVTVTRIEWRYLDAALVVEPVQCRCPHGPDWHAAGGCEARGCPCEVEPR